MSRSTKSIMAKASRRRSCVRVPVEEQGGTGLWHAVSNGSMVGTATCSPSAWLWALGKGGREPGKSEEPRDGRRWRWPQSFEVTGRGVGAGAGWAVPSRRVVLCPREEGRVARPPPAPLGIPLPTIRVSEPYDTSVPPQWGSSPKHRARVPSLRQPVAPRAPPPPSPALQSCSEHARPCHPAPRDPPNTLPAAKPPHTELPGEPWAGDRVMGTSHHPAPQPSTQDCC